MSEYTAPDEIPVLRGRTVVCLLSAAICMAHPSRYRVVMNGGRTPRPVRAIMRERLTPWTPLTSDGTGFIQRDLITGPLWALKGTSGSGKREVPA